jgi:ABC-2 type transport system ATP-binding protein
MEQNKQDDFVIETNGLQKCYGGKAAVDDLTLQVPRGEVFGFLGPNGAGKSTSVKMLLGLIAPTGGNARVLGHPPGHREAMARIGFLPEHFRFPEWLRARELLDLHGQLYGMERETRRRRIPELLDRVRLSNYANRPLTDFSKGMLQRIGLAQALINDPDLVILDEPTSALDPFGRMLVRQIIRELKEQGTTVFLNSHLLGEVEATCNRVSFIKAGRVLHTIGLDEFHATRLVVEVRVDPLPSDLPAALARVAGAEPVVSSPLSPATLELPLPDESLLPVVAEQVMASGARLYGLIPRRTSLEQLFLEVVGGETGDAGSAGAKQESIHVNR